VQSNEQRVCQFNTDRDWASDEHMLVQGNFRRQLRLHQLPTGFSSLIQCGLPCEVSIRARGTLHENLLNLNLWNIDTSQLLIPRFDALINNHKLLLFTLQCRC
jgi:hypothetical protein